MHFVGQPDPGKKWKPPESVLDGQVLLRQNCMGCHGFDSTVGPAIALDDPTFLQLVTESSLKETISRGRKGTRMPAFDKKNGGNLSEEQIDAVVSDLLAKKTSRTPSFPLPGYVTRQGDAIAGQTAFGIYCAACHGADGQGSRMAGSVTDPAYLGLVSDQYLHTLVIAGRPELGMPPAGARNISDKETHDIVAWLASHRRDESGFP